VPKDGEKPGKTDPSETLAVTASQILPLDRAPPPPPSQEPTETIAVTASQIMPIDRPPPAPPSPPVMRGGKRKSTTHGVAWYGADDGESVPAPRRRTWLMLVVGSAAVGLGVGGAAYYFSERGQSSTPPAAQTTPAVVPPAVPDAGPPAPPPKMVKLILRSTPVGAEFSVDGKVVGRSPIDAEVAEKTTVLVEATLDGFETYHEQVTAGRRRRS
jgi:hypothetical protein